MIAAVALVLAGFTLWWFVARGRSPPDFGGREDASNASSLVAGDSGSATRGATVPDRVPTPAVQLRSTSPAPAAARTGEAASASTAASPSADGMPCDDGDLCTFDDRWTGGACRGRPLHCDDENPLTIDSCAGDGCAHTFVPGAFELRATTGP